MAEPVSGWCRSWERRPAPDAPTRLPPQRAAITAEGVRARVRVAVARAGSLRALAREWGVSPAWLSEYLAGDSPPGPAILGALGLRRVVTYVEHDT